MCSAHKWRGAQRATETRLKLVARGWRVVASTGHLPGRAIVHGDPYGSPDRSALYRARVGSADCAVKARPAG